MEGGLGFCAARGMAVHPCTGEKNVVSLNYGKLTSLALDPIEKKPLRHFHPGKKILSAGSFGCNLNCPWCQNHGIARAKEDDVPLYFIGPETLTDLAEKYIPEGNIGVAFTYNEPLISYEYVLDTSKLLKECGLKSVLVTNGYANPDKFAELLPQIDAMNIDLKSIRNDFYKKIGGGVDTVLTNIRAASKSCHVELTCLLIEGMNDTEAEMRDMVDFIASVSPEMPLHISRFFPRYELADRNATRIESIEEFEEIAVKKLKFVHL
jgi:pyruvate formate lyase activating enzyme